MQYLGMCQKKSAVFEEKISDLAQKNEVIIIPVYFDLSNGEDIKNGFKNIYNNKRPIDVLVNTAGVINAEIFQRINVATMHDVFEINFFGPVQLSQLVLKSMLRYKNGSIINISSIAGLDTNPTNSIYGSSKAALNSFTKILASEVATSGIRVNAIAPGPTDTEMIQVVQNKVGNALLDRCAMGRLARPDEIAETALFLASEKSSFINGQILRVDGGAK